MLDVGSQDINGSVRPYFRHANYLGVDIVAGPGVDRVIIPGDLPPGPYDTVVSTEMLEHDLRPWRSIEAMAGVLKPGGHLLLTARGFDERGVFDIHCLPDRWRFSSEAIAVMVEDAGLTVIESVSDPWAPGWFCVARHP